jgi:hypothetical protein
LLTACGASKGVIVIAYAADIDEPCAYIVTIDEKQVGPTPCKARIGIGCRH